MNCFPHKAITITVVLRRWKELIDGPTGAQIEYFWQEKQFDKMYGAKESAKPLVTLDTLENKYEQPRRKKSTVKRR